jgi:redox-sensitive bicupin YhaK (pirin superfamily)
MVELTASHVAQVGALPVRRALPRRGRRTVGAWCFLDHMGPLAVTEDHGADVAPHPHCGLQTVTWLLAGEIVHRDSLGSEQVIRPGQLNLMTAGHGVAHSEEGTGRYRGDVHGIQLWVAQPDATRDGPAAFEHHASLPAVELRHGTATLLVGRLGEAESPARRDTEHLAADLDLRAGTTTVPLDPLFEHALVVASGAVDVDTTVIEPGHLAYLGAGRQVLDITTSGAARLMLIGGAPFGVAPLMFWNFVARTRDEMRQAYADWQSDSGRFGNVRSTLPRIASPPLPWR